MRKYIFYFFILLFMIPESTTAQVLCGSIQELQKHEGDTFSFFGRIYFDYDLPHCPAILLLNDNSKIFIGKNESHLTQFQGSQFVIIKGVARSTNPTFNYTSYLNKPGKSNFIPGRVDHPDSVIRSMPFFERIDSVISVERINNIGNNDGRGFLHVICVGRIQDGNTFCLANDGKKILLPGFVSCQLPNGNKEELIGLYGNLVVIGKTFSLMNIQCVWDFPICKTADDFERLQGREVVLEGKLEKITLNKTNFTILVLGDKTNVYVDQGKDILENKKGKKTLLTTISLVSPKPFYLPSEVWNPGIFHVADNLICIVH